MNGIIIINKPSDWTSHDVVAKLRGILRQKRIGHGGTLDPMATGVLPVFVGRATRAVQFCESYDKEYVAGIRFGITTDTQDITGTVLTETASNVTSHDLSAVIPEFIGQQLQIPPMYSAVKIGGQKMYELARRGIDVERNPREINIKSLEIVDETADGFSLRIVCSKGTYIRTLCHDIGQRLSCGAVMSSLLRSRVGTFTLESSVTIEQVQQHADDDINKILMPVDRLFDSHPAATLSADLMDKCKNGNSFSLSDTENGLYRVYGPSGDFLMLGEMQDNIMKTVKSFFEV